MQASVLDLNGKPVEQIELPKIFSEPIREDLILRAVLSSQSRRRQPYGTSPLAGKRTAAGFHGGRPGRTGAHRWAMVGREMARLPRLHGKTVPWLTFRARFVPQAVKGREAFPPLVERVWEQKINHKERKKAIMSAISATAIKELVVKRGHKVEKLKLPLVVEDKVQSISKTKDLVEFLEKIGLQGELQRIKEKKIRAGKGKSRGRRYKKKTGILFIITEDKGISKSVKNLTGCNVCRVENLSTEYLAPGASLGRLTIFTKSAIEKLK
ncbi:MAG: 50S ribosomal protein L4 [Candidatus Aenigmarchaeota archaeon]|nr:50S ribosomal protein L4 [Candidatus Aenigmarchaeota archaeon]